MKYLALALGTAAGLIVGALFGNRASAQQATAAQPALPVAPAAATVPPHRWSPQQVREAFELADADLNGELTRAEVQRIPALPRTFEELDQNKDGVVARAEYEAAFAR